MMQLRIANLSDAALISRLAHEIWPITYAGVISEEQVTFMLDASYTIRSIDNQMEAGHQFFILEVANIPQGFASISKETELEYKLHKLYINPDMHKKGAGKFFLSAIEAYLKEKGAKQMLLNVNRNNTARFFYEKMGYSIIEVVDIPYFKYVLNDYVMAKILKSS